MLRIFYAMCHENAKELYHGHDDDACWDVYAATRRFVEEHRDPKTGKNIPRHYLYGTGLRFCIPRGYEIEVRPRSSIFTTGMVLANAPGTVDCGYSGEMMAHFYEVVQNGTIYEVGDRIMQIKVNPALYYETQFILVSNEELEEMYAKLPEYAGRGAHGFGSTGRK